MKIPQEKNIGIFDKDVDTKKGYIYSKKNNYSATIATKRQTNEMVRVIEKHFPKKIDILDLGCGDGTFTTALFEKLKPNSILGIDPAVKAINLAKKKHPKYKSQITYRVGNIYNADKFKEKIFDLVILRGVLHHLYEPEKAIHKISKIGKNVLVVEPNGYNPVLKIIEKISKYHIEHEEQSYWPPTLNNWFVLSGYTVLEQEFFSIVPYFCNRSIVVLLKMIEPLLEKFPIIRNFICGTNLILYRK